MSNFNGTVLNSGSGGPTLATSTFVNGSPAQNELMPWSAIAYLASGNANDTTGVFQTVGPATGFPTAATQSGSWSMSILAGSALIGQVELSDGTNVLGTSAHPVVVSINNSVTLAGTSAVSIADGANTTFGAEADAAALTDTATATHMALIKRQLQHLSALIAQLPTALSGSGNLKVAIEESVTTVTVSVNGTTTVAGTVTANIGTTGGLALDATLTGGSAKTIARGGQKGSTNTNADITHTASGLNHELLDIAIYDAAGNQLGTSGAPLRIDPTGTTTQPVSIAGTVTVTTSGTTTVAGTITANQGGAPWSMVGNVASGATDSGNPVKVGGVFNSVAPTLTSGQRADLQLDSSANLKVNVVAGGGSGSNAAAGLTGSAVPTDADYSGVNVGGTLRGQTGVSPSLNVYAAQVDLSSVAGTTLDTNGGLKSAGTVRVVLATDQPALTNPQPVSAAQSGSWTQTANQGTPAALTGAWPVNVTDGATTMPTGASSATSIHTTIDNASLAVTFSGTHDANLAQVAGTTTSVNTGSADAGTQRVVIGTDDGILTDSRWSSADDNAHNVKASAGHLFKIEVTNNGAGPVYLKLYNKASAPVPGTDTPVRRYIIPGGTTGAGATIGFGEGRNFSTGIGYVLSGAAGDADTTALAANQCAINVDYR